MSTSERNGGPVTNGLNEYLRSVAPPLALMKPAERDYATALIREGFYAGASCAAAAICQLSDPRTAPQDIRRALFVIVKDCADSIKLDISGAAKAAGVTQ